MTFIINLKLDTPIKDLNYTGPFFLRNVINLEHKTINLIDFRKWHYEIIPNEYFNYWKFI